MALRRKPRIKFFLIIAVLVLAVVIALIFIFRGQPTAAIEWASIEYNADFDMLVIRDEVVYEAKNYGKTYFLASEGEKVDVGDPIVEVYEWGYNDETLSKLLDKQKTILDYEIEVSREGIIDEKLNEINDRINGKANDIQQAVFDKRPKDVLELERDMKILLQERMAYLKSVVVPNDQLREYYADEQVLLEQIAGWRSAVDANESGVVSFYFDGCEVVMAKENIGSFTKVIIEEIQQGKTIETPQQNQTTAPLYRVVNENEWYVVMLCEKSIPEMHIGNIFSLVFEDYLETQYSGVVYDATKLEENEGFVYTILIQDNIGPLLGERRVSAKLYNVQEGMRLPASCVKETEQVNYVETVDGELVPVFIIADDEEYIFIQTYQDQATLEIGQLIKR